MDSGLAVVVLTYSIPLSSNRMLEIPTLGIRQRGAPDCASKAVNTPRSNRYSVLPFSTHGAADAVCRPYPDAYSRWVNCGAIGYDKLLCQSFWLFLSNTYITLPATSTSTVFMAKNDGDATTSPVQGAMSLPKTRWRVTA